MADRGMNRVFLLGRLTQDPEVKDAGNRQYAWLQVAVNTEQPGSGGDRFKTEFIRCQHWQMGVIPYLAKGRQVAIEGRLESFRKSPDAPYMMSVNVDRLVITSEKSNGAGAGDEQEGYFARYAAELQARCGALEAKLAEALARKTPERQKPTGEQFSEGAPKYERNPRSADIGTFPARKRATAKQPAKPKGKTR